MNASSMLSPACVAEHPIDEVHLRRWSPHAFDGSVISKDQLLSLFGAARWAPSAFNVQPRRLVYALRNTPEWAGVFASLLP